MTSDYVKEQVRTKETLTLSVSIVLRHGRSWYARVSICEDFVDGGVDIVVTVVFAFVVPIEKVIVDCTFLRTLESTVLVPHVELQSHSSLPPQIQEGV